jgi:GNAT superfamily N-acetyltransferase
MKILPFQPEDSDAVLLMHRENYENLHLERFIWQPCRQIESLEKPCLKIVFKDEVTKGYAAVYALDATHFRLNLLVAPKYKRQRIGTRLFRQIEREAKSKGCLSLQARTLEALPGGSKFALENGFEEVHRMRGMSLRATDFSFAKWNALGTRLADENFVVTTLADESRAGRQPVEKLVRLHKKAVQGWALIDPTVSHNTDPAYLTAFFAGAKRPERVSIIKHGEKYVGYTSAEKDNLLGTAVHPNYRGRGIATYLKAFDLNMQFADGVRYIESATANPAMIRVNERLGYKFNGLTEIRLVKRL